MSQQAFSTLKLNNALISNIDTLGYKTMTTIQAQSLPAILEGKDVVAQAKTGSGKTAAFGLGLLEALDVKKFRIQSLVLCPTRELADQVAKELRKLARSIHNIKILTLCGGLPFGPQIGSLAHGAHIIVGTPGRIEDHINKGRLDLSNLEILVLDEADRMLEMGFQSSLDAVIAEVPKQRQTLLFSATYPQQIQQIAKKVTNNAIEVTVEEEHDSSSISEHFYKVPLRERTMAIASILSEQQPKACVIFCNTKKETFTVADELEDLGFNALALNGDLEQRDRDQTLVQFANKTITILVATDVAARGLDIDELDMVVNHQLSHDPEVHVHRVGRTGRAGSSGTAISFFDHQDGTKLVALEEYTKKSISEEDFSALNRDEIKGYGPKMTTIRIDGGKKHKVRAGDILGALTGKDGIDGKSVGKIHIFDLYAYVAVEKKVLRPALRKLEKGRIKGKTFRVWQVKQYKD